MKKQEILVTDSVFSELDYYLKKIGVKRLLLVCGESFSSLAISKSFETIEKRIGVKIVKFSNYKPNPTYDSVVEGVKIFRQNNCDTIMAVGGGSAMDVAKCIKLFSNMDASVNYIEQKITPNDVNLIALPTTAGSGSEATRYAVIYYNGEKQSIADESCIPSCVLMDASVLKTLPLYQKKSTMLDALCHSMESFWSVNSTEESKQYSREAIQLMMKYKNAYLANEAIGNTAMLKAANIAGKAINITQTTAGHAMCYKLTSLYGIAHGHAAALCNAALWPYMAQHMEKCIDPRGKDYLEDLFLETASAMGCGSIEEALTRYQSILAELGMDAPIMKNVSDLEVLTESVNPARLRNNPVRLDKETLRYLYKLILNIN